MPLQALLLDFNSYFASVEQQLRPELRGRPVGVLPVLAESTCCIAASREAKRFGVKTGTMVSEARKRCPDIVFVQARPRVYVEMHHKLMAAVDKAIPLGDILSIDEVACELTGTWQQEAVAVERAKMAKARVREVGEYLTCSIGIGPNRFLAKTASNMQKPDGLVVIHDSDLPDILFGLEPQDLHGIGRHMLARLERHGITTVQTLCATSRERLRQVWGGVGGEQMYDQLRGIEPPRQPTRRSTLGHSHVLPPHLRDDPGAFAVLSKLTQKAALRLRAEGYLAGRLDLYVGYRKHDTWGLGTRFAPVDHTIDFLRLLEGLWAFHPRHRGDEPMKVGMVLSELQHKDYQTLSLLSDGVDRGANLDKVLDHVKLKYGNNAIYYGAAARALDEAPMRISFTHVPDLVLEADGLAEPELAESA